MVLINTKDVPSVISKSVNIVGDITNGGNIEIEGNIEGNVTADTITIREGGIIKGNIKSKVLNIKGSFNGNANSEKINISDTANINGLLEYNFLSADYGASINCELKRTIEQKSTSKIVDILKKENKENKENKEKELKKSLI